jgi:hypothetical protein
MSYVLFASIRKIPIRIGLSCLNSIKGKVKICGVNNRLHFLIIRSSSHSCYCVNDASVRCVMRLHHIDSSMVLIICLLVGPMNSAEVITDLYEGRSIPCKGSMTSSRTNATSKIQITVKICHRHYTAPILR